MRCAGCSWPPIVAAACGMDRDFGSMGSAPTGPPSAPHAPPHAIAEDEAAIAANYRDTLQRQGFRVSLFSDRGAPRGLLLRAAVDLAIIDTRAGWRTRGRFRPVPGPGAARCPELPHRVSHRPDLN